MTDVWNRWLVEADSVHELAPENFDHAAARAQIRALGEGLIGALPELEVRIGSDELYQDSTGLAAHRITAKGDRRQLQAAGCQAGHRGVGRFGTVVPGGVRPGVGPARLGLYAGPVRGVVDALHPEGQERRRIRWPISRCRLAGTPPAWVQRK